MKTIAKLLLIAALSGCAHSAAVPTALELPPVPAELSSAYGPISVQFADSLADPIGRELMGAFSPARWTIFISRTVTARHVQWAILFHEQCHAELMISGIYNVIEAPVAQLICDLWALREIRRTFGPR